MFIVIFFFIIKINEKISMLNILDICIGKMHRIHIEYQKSRKRDEQKKLVQNKSENEWTHTVKLYSCIKHMLGSFSTTTKLHRALAVAI